MLKQFCALAALAVASLSGSYATAANIYGVYITEFNSNAGDGSDHEFVEFTNTSAVPVNMTGWSQDDSTRAINKAGHILSAFGTLAPGESAIFTEATPDAFRTYWWGSPAAAPAGLKIIGPYSNDNLSSGGDEVNLYAPGALNGTTDFADRLTYNGSPNAPFGGGNASGVTRNPGPLTVLGDNMNINWVNSFVGDSYGSFAAFGNPNLVGNPGSFVPEPGTLALGAIGAAFGLLAIRRKRAVK
ncbi:MAG: lamin tail domain-containing protein [Planctomycetota bacterium]|nr:lamin tail domain-containing protein [Planctomycetota bacterium]